MLPAFEENGVRKELASLPWPRALAFAAACAERIVPNYQKFKDETGWGDLASLRQALDMVWETAKTATTPNESIVQARLTGCEAAVPESEDFDSLFTAGAQDAVFAICSLLDFISARSVDKLVVSARYPTDSVDLYIQEAEGMAPHDLNLEQRILAHPLMQQELSRQQRDLNRLRAGGANAIEDIQRTAAVEKAFEVDTPE